MVSSPRVLIANCACRITSGKLILISVLTQYEFGLFLHREWLVVNTPDYRRVAMIPRMRPAVPICAFYLLSGNQFQVFLQNPTDRNRCSLNWLPRNRRPLESLFYDRSSCNSVLQFSIDRSVPLRLHEFHDYWVLVKRSYSAGCILSSANGVTNLD